MPQWIQIKFEQPVTLKSFNFMFQGGFSGTKLIVASESAASSSSKQETFYPEDINKIQEFQLSELHENIDKIRFTFETCSDFFGRIIVYQLDLFWDSPCSLINKKTTLLVFCIFCVFIPKKKNPNVTKSFQCDLYNFASSRVKFIICNVKKFFSNRKRRAFEKWLAPGILGTTRWRPPKSRPCKCNTKRNWFLLSQLKARQSSRTSQGFQPDASECKIYVQFLFSYFLWCFFAILFSLI